MVLEAEVEPRHVATRDPAPSDRLDSWKAIAAYLGRGLRTVQRWETEEGLPVRRQRHGPSGSVYAFRSDLESWRRAREIAPARVVAPPVESGASVPRPAVPRRAAWRWGRTAGLLVLALLAVTLRGPSSASVDGGPLRLVVVPFRNLTGDPSVDAVGRRLTEETLTRIARHVHGLAVTSIGEPASPADGYRLEGSVRRAAGGLRVTARLLDPVDRRVLWAESLERAALDGAAQAELARRVASAVSATLRR
jgi:TolB-like protein